MKKFHKFTSYLWLFTLLLPVGIGFTYAQNTVQSSVFWENVRYGGGIGLGFGSNSFNIQLAPSAIYQANPYLGMGLGLNFNYARFGDQKFTAYGGSLIGLFNPVRPLQLSAEFEELRIHREINTPQVSDSESYWLPALFAGIGYSNGNLTFGIRYDLLYDENRSIYANPWMPFVRVYF